MQRVLRRHPVPDDAFGDQNRYSFGIARTGTLLRIPDFGTLRGPAWASNTRRARRPRSSPIRSKARRGHDPRHLSDLPGGRASRGRPRAQHARPARALRQARARYRDLAGDERRRQHGPGRQRLGNGVLVRASVRPRRHAVPSTLPDPYAAMQFDEELGINYCTCSCEWYDSVLNGFGSGRCRWSAPAPGC